MDGIKLNGVELPFEIQIYLEDLEEIKLQEEFLDKRLKMKAKAIKDACKRYGIEYAELRFQLMDQRINLYKFGEDLETDGDSPIYDEELDKKYNADWL
jgi:hypothetical protein